MWRSFDTIIKWVGLELTHVLQYPYFDTNTNTTNQRELPPLINLAFAMAQIPNL
jgi:hypothetical protein